MPNKSFKVNTLFDNIKGMTLQRVWRWLTKAFFFAILLLLLLQLPLKGKSLMNHYLDETNNKYLHAMGNLINGIKDRFSGKKTFSLSTYKNIDVDKLIESSKLSESFLFQEENKPKEIVKEKLIKSRVPKKLASPQPQGEHFTSEDEKRLNEILLSN